MPKSPEGRFQISSPGAILAILAFINFINYVDRQIIGALVPLLEAPPASGGLGLSDSQAGSLQMAFMVVHSIASVPLGVLADHFLRKRLIALGVTVWSVATALAAGASSFITMFFARAAVGVGEAAYAPAATALISEKFRPEARARALSVFQVGMMVGGGAAGVIGGQIGGTFGWRAAFLVVGVPGLVLALLALFIHEKPLAERGEGERADGELNVDALVAEAKELARSPAVRWINIAGILITFFIGAVVFFAPVFILRFHYHGEHLRQTDVAAWKAAVKHIGIVFGALSAATALPGAFVGSFLADRWERSSPGTGRLRVVAIGSIAAAPAAVIGFFTRDLNVLYVAIGTGVFFASWYVGPILAALHDVVEPGRRGAITGIYLLLVHLLGDAISPFIVGRISVRTGSLRVGLAVAVAMLMLGGLAALRAIPESQRLAKLKRDAPPG